VLTACAGSAPSTEPPELPEAPGALTRPCDRPVALPADALTQAEVEEGWITDRLALADCATRHGDLARWTADLAEWFGP
jgi:hypothetical protein